MSQKEQSVSEDDSKKVKEEDESKESSSKAADAGEAAESSRPVESIASANLSDDSAVEAIRKYMAEKLGFTDSKKSSEPKKKQMLDEVSVDGVVRYILSEKCKNIIVMAGAGISTSAGIPDFRSPKSGLYDNLAKYNLPHPQAIFEIEFFIEKPEPFYELAKELMPGAYKPTPTHYFVKLLNEKGLLLRHYTQNIDGLERVADIPVDKIVEAHGTFHVSHCLMCKAEYNFEWMNEKVTNGVIPKCTTCDGLIKPDIVFFGENLPDRFYKLVKEDFGKADLLLIMGSSLVVQPFASLVDRVKSTCPRMLMNREKAGQKDRLMSLLGMSSGLELDPEKSVRDVAFLGECDDLCQQLVEKLDWSEEYKQIMKQHE